MFKKLLAILLSIILIITSIICSVTADGGDVVLSLDFENYPSGGALNRFKIADTGDAAYGKALYGNFTAADANMSPAAAIFTSGSMAKLSKGTEYQISLSYKAINLNSTFAFNLYYADNANSYVRKKVPDTTTNTPAVASPYVVRFAHNGTGATPRNEWIDVTVPFTPEYDAYVYLGLWTNAITEFYVDNVVISKKAATPPPAPVDPDQIVGLDFESYPATGALNKFKIADTGDAAQGKALYGNFSAADANMSPAAALMTSATDTKLQKGETYEVTLKYKAINLNSAFALNLYYTDNANSYIRKKIPDTTTNTAAAVSPYLVRLAHNGAGATPKNEWIEVKASFTAEYDAYVYIGLWTNAITEFYVDDFVIKKVSSVKVNFNTNGGNDIEPLSGVSGAALPTLPTPTKENASFIGWYTDAELTTGYTGIVYPDADITLYAKWGEANVLHQNFETYIPSGNMLSNGFEIYTKANAEDNKVYEGNKSLYRKGENSSYFAALFPDKGLFLEAGKGYEIKMQVYMPATPDPEGAIRLTFLEDAKNSHSGQNRSQVNFKYFANNYDTSGWQEITINFIAEHNSGLGIYSFGGYEVYIDDITIKAVEIAKITMDSMGGEMIAPVVGAVGQVIEKVPVPTHKDNLSFAGWYKDADFNEKFDFYTIPNEDITVYAKWIAEGTFEQGFEAYYYDKRPVSTAYDKSGYTFYNKTNDNDPYVRSGNTSVRYKDDPSKNGSYAYAISLFDPTMGKLTVGEKYRVSVHMKFKDIGVTFYHALYNNSVVNNPYANYTMKMYSTVHKDILSPDKPIEEYCHGVGDKFQVSGPDEKGWYKFTYEATATEDYFSLYLAYIAEVYIDDVSIVPLATGVVSENYSKPYAEPLYDEVFSNYPEAKNKKSNDLQIYRLDLTPRGDYLFSVAVNENAGGAYAALSFDVDGKNIIEGTKITEGSAVKRVILDMSGTVYLIVYNPLGEGAFERLLLFNTRAAKDEANKNTLPKANGELPELSELLKSDKYADVLLDSEFIDRDESVEKDNESDYVTQNSSVNSEQSNDVSSESGETEDSGDSDDLVQSDAQSSNSDEDDLYSDNTESTEKLTSSEYEEEQNYQENSDNATDNYSPQTGDSVSVMIILFMLLISSSVLIVLSPNTKKEG